MNPAAYIGLVTAKRALGASWGAISGMTGVSVPDLRKAFDPTWPKDFNAARQPLPEITQPKAVNAKPSSGRKEVTRAKPGTLTSRILLAISAGAATTQDIITATGADHGSVAVMLSRMKHGGLVSGAGDYRFVWSLTEVSDALLSGLPAPTEVAA